MRQMVLHHWIFVSAISGWYWPVATMPCQPLHRVNVTCDAHNQVILPDAVLAGTLVTLKNSNLKCKCYRVGSYVSSSLACAVQVALDSAVAVIAACSAVSTAPFFIMGSTLANFSKSLCQVKIQSSDVVIRRVWCTLAFENAALAAACMALGG